MASGAAAAAAGVAPGPSSILLAHSEMTSAGRSPNLIEWRIADKHSRWQDARSGRACGRRNAAREKREQKRSIKRENRLKHTHVFAGLYYISATRKHRSNHVSSRARVNMAFWSICSYLAKTWWKTAVQPAISVSPPNRRSSTLEHSGYQATGGAWEGGGRGGSPLMRKLRKGGPGTDGRRAREQRLQHSTGQQAIL